MKLALICLLSLATFAAAELAEDPWVEEEELEGPYNEEEFKHERRTRAIEEEPVHNCETSERVRRSAVESDYVRRPRQVHQYEVHEFQEEESQPAVRYEEVPAESVEHYHKIYAPASKSARRLNPDVSRSSNILGVNVPSHDPDHFVSASSKLATVQQAPLHVANSVPSGTNNYASHVVPAPIRLSAANGLPPVVVPSPQADQHPAAGHHHQQKHHGQHGHTQGGGHGHQGHHYNEHGAKTSKGFKTDQYVDKGGKGFKKDENHRKEYEEAAGKKTKHHDHAGHKGDHEEEAHGHRGSNFDEKKGHKKGHKTKGYHNKYHKDEFHKEHKFYDDFHKSGEHHRYGKFNAKHASNESGKKKAHHVNAGHDFVERGKKGYSNKGHVDDDHKGHNAKHGHEEHHENHSQYGKKGAKEGGSHWGHAKKN